MRRKTLSFCCLALVMVLGTVPAWAAEEAEQDGGWFGVTARVVNFAILAGGLFYLLRKPLGNYLNARAEEIRQQLAEADKKRGQAAREKQRAEAQRAALDEEIARVRAQAQVEVEAERQRILKAADEEGARIVATARKEIAAELEIARRNLMARATELSVELARERIAKEMTEDDRNALVERSIDILKEAR